MQIPQSLFNGHSNVDGILITILTVHWKVTVVVVDDNSPIFSIDCIFDVHWKVTEVVDDNSPIISIDSQDCSQYPIPIGK